jgi:maleate isomerase
MQSAGAAMNDRLVDYGQGIPRWLEAFGQAPLDAVAFACTGTSYLLGPADPPLPETVEHAGRTVPVVTAAGAIGRALAERRVRTIALVTPYPRALTEAAVAYWRGRGFEVASVTALEPAAGYHPIYGQNNASAFAAVAEAREAGADVALVMGTGAPSLAALAVALKRPGPPVLSSNLCLGWRLSQVLGGEASEPLGAWLAADAPWARRLADRFPAAFAGLA